MKWLKRALFILGITLIVAVILIAVFISPITKYLIERYSKEYTGRQIRMESLFLNFFTGSLSIGDLKIYEPNDKDVFFECHKLIANVTVKKLFYGEYEINKLQFVSPKINISQSGNHFSFDDIVARFTSSDSASTDSSAPVKYWIHNFEIDSGYIHYINVPIQKNTEIINFNLATPLFAWNDPNSIFHTNFGIGTGGTIKADLTLNRDDLDYILNADISKFDLQNYYLPLRTLLEVKSLNGFLNANLKFRGNFNEIGDIATSGSLSIDDLAIKDSTNDDFANLKQFFIEVDTLNVKKNLYNFHKIAFDQPAFKFDLYGNGNNISHMIVSTSDPPADSTTQINSSQSSLDYSNIFTLIASYIKEIAENYIVSNYSADSVVIRNGLFVYNDYSLNDRFTYELGDVDILSGKINSKNDSIRLRVSSVINQKGSLNGYFRVTPDFKSMNISYSIHHIRVSDWNPFTRYYVATPFFDGNLDYTSTTDIVNHELKSNNEIYITDLTAGKKVNKNPIYNLPVRLAVSLLKDVHGNIDVKIPVEGDLSDPNYRLGKVIWQVVTNLIVKAASAPYKLLAGLFGSNEEEMKEVTFDYLQRDFSDKQLKGFDRVVEVLKAKPELDAELTQLTDTAFEREQLALFDAKRQYYMEKIQKTPNDSLSDNDLKAINAIENKDSLFNQFLNDKLNIKSSQLISVQDKCIRLEGASKVNEEFRQLMAYRNEQLENYLLKQKSVSADRVKILNNHDATMSQGLSQPRYLINYSAEDSLAR